MCATMIRAMAALILLASCSDDFDADPPDADASSVTGPDVNICEAREGTSRAIQDCVDALASGPVGGTVLLTAQTYLLESTVHVRYAHTTIRGLSSGTLLQDATQGGGALFHWHDVAGGGMRDMYIYSSQQGTTAIRVDDVEMFDITNVTLRLDVGTGLHLHGRDSITVRDVSSFADKPLTIGPYAGYFDHVNFHNFYAIEYGLDDPIVYIHPQTGIQGLTFTGFQAWVGGSHGLHWGERPDDFGRSSSIRIENMHREQSAGTGQSIYINKRAHNHVDHVTCVNCWFAYESDGVYMRGVKVPSVTHSTYDGAPGREFIDVGGSPYVVANVVNERGSK